MSLFMEHVQFILIEMLSFDFDMHELEFSAVTRTLVRSFICSFIQLRSRSMLINSKSPRSMCIYTTASMCAPLHNLHATLKP